MERADILAKLTAIFRETFDDNALVLRPSMTADDVEGWDSLSHVRLLVSVEEAMGIKFTTAEILGLKDVGQLIDLVAAKT
jgi:acyl carrier protein